MRGFFFLQRGNFEQQRGFFFLWELQRGNSFACVEIFFGTRWTEANKELSRTMEKFCSRLRNWGNSLGLSHILLSSFLGCRISLHSLYSPSKTVRETLGEESSEIRWLLRNFRSSLLWKKRRWTELSSGSSMWKQIWSFTPAASEVWSFHSSLIFGLYFKAPDNSSYKHVNFKVLKSFIPVAAKYRSRLMV